MSTSESRKLRLVRGALTLTSLVILASLAVEGFLLLGLLLFWFFDVPDSPLGYSPSFGETFGFSENRVLYTAIVISTTLFTLQCLLDFKLPDEPPPPPPPSAAELAARAIEQHCNLFKTGNYDELKFLPDHSRDAGRGAVLSDFLRSRLSDQCRA